MKLKTLSIFATLLLVATLATPALADATITVSGGSLSVTPQAITFSAVTLNGAAQTSTGTTSAWTTVDPTGTGSGWHLNIKATDFSTGGASPKTIAVSGFKIQLLDASVAVTDGNTKPVSQITTMTALSTTDQSLVSANANTGMGTYTLTPTFQLTVPADAYAGSYTSTVTLTMVSGP